MRPSGVLQLSARSKAPALQRGPGAAAAAAPRAQHPPCGQCWSSHQRRARRVVTRATGHEHSSTADAFSSTVEPSRHMPLPNNAMWLLDFLQDKFYDVRGANFVIQRAESDDNGSTMRRKKNRRSGKPVVQPSGSGSAAKGTGSSRALSLINRVVHQYPGSIMLQLEGAVVDISEWLEACEEQPAPLAANHTCTGIVRVEQQDEEAQAPAEEADVFYNNSASPRRTKLVGFTCKCCGARTYSQVNPKVFHEGTLVAQCAKCERWHKLSDHFGLFHELQGPLLGRPLVQVDDVPESLRLRDSEWDF